MVFQDDRFLSLINSPLQVCVGYQHVHCQGLPVERVTLVTETGLEASG